MVVIALGGRGGLAGNGAKRDVVTMTVAVTDASER